MAKKSVETSVDIVEKFLGPSSRLIAKQKEGNLANQNKTKMRSFRLREGTIKALKELTQTVNGKSNIKISETSILEVLINNAAKEGENKIFKLINK